jgi:hypothetical protein
VLPGSSEYSRQIHGKRFEYDQDDNFQVALSTFNDKRNGYLFVINPNGARADLLISGNEEANKDWNGVWDCKTSKTNEGWFAEIRIPLQFSAVQKRFSTNMGYQLLSETSGRRMNRCSGRAGQGIASIFCLANAGILTELTNIGYVKRFELKPYALGGFEKKLNEKTEHPGKIGGDLNINLTQR